MQTTALARAIRRFGPVGFWPLNETGGTIAIDYSGRGLNGTYTSTVTPGRRRVGRLIAPDFGGGYVAIADNAALSPHAGASGKMTIIAHVVPDTFAANRMAVTKGQSPYEFDLRGQASGGADCNTFASNGSTADSAVSAAGVLVAGRAAQMVMVYDKAAGFLRLFVDNVQVGEDASLGTTTSDTTSSMAIGRRDDLAGSVWDGAICMVAMFPHALGASQRTALWRAWLRDRSLP